MLKSGFECDIDFIFVGLEYWTGKLRAVKRALGLDYDLNNARKFHIMYVTKMQMIEEDRDTQNNQRCPTPMAVIKIQLQILKEMTIRDVR